MTRRRRMSRVKAPKAAPPAATVVLRPVTAGDSERLLAWRNDAETRRQSRTMTRVTRSAHAAWLSKTLENRDVRLYIAENGFGHPVGTGRLDYRGQAMAELSLTVAPEWRGQGIGGRIIKALGREAVRHGWHHLLARVKPSNAASLRAFVADGFASDGCVHLERKA